MRRVDIIRDPVVPAKIMRLEDVRMAHPGSPGVIFGKGPSLDTFDLPRRPDDIWMTLNEACKVVDTPDYAFMSDTGVTCGLKAEGWHPDEGTLVVGKDVTFKHKNNRDWLEWIVGPEGTVLYLHPFPKDILGGSSGCCALSIFKMMGIEDILMVGFDAWTDLDNSGWSEKVNATMPESRLKWDYRSVNDTMRKALTITKLEPVWWHLEEAAVRETWNA